MFWVIQRLCSVINSQHLLTIGKHKACVALVAQGVPQVSTLGPLLFTIYKPPLGHNCHHDDFLFYSYAHDTHSHNYYNHYYCVFVLVRKFDWSSGIPRVLILNVTALGRFPVCITSLICNQHIKFQF